MSITVYFNIHIGRYGRNFRRVMERDWAEKCKGRPSGAALGNLEVVAGACNAPKPTILILPFSFALTREVAA